MSGAGAERRALRPLWLLATAAAIGAVVGLHVTAPPSVANALLLLGAAALAAALGSPRRHLPWLLAGLALAGGRAVELAQERARLAEVTALGDHAAMRVDAAVHDGWVPTRWGRQATVTIVRARHGDAAVRLRGRWRLEVRGATGSDQLPAPGATFSALAAVRGDEALPFLAVSSAALLEPLAPPRGLAALRDRLAASLLEAAGTNVRRVRSAELAAAVVLGRRDLLPRERREGWRRSGLAHLLAVSGLHVGLVGGVLWLALSAGAVHPRRIRWLLLAAVPGYALLAGASPSAVRAALMAAVYLGGRQLGRAVLPMGSVLLAASMLLISSPGLIAEASFQLTVLVTAALVRWVPPVTSRLPCPRRLAALVAVPVVAQVAAAPIAAAHFRSAIPGAVAANLLVPTLLAPTLALALLAVLLAPSWPAGAGLALDLVGVGERLMWRCGAAGRGLELVLPSPPPWAVVALLAAGWLALQAGRRGALGAAAWGCVVAVVAATWWLAPLPPDPRVELLEVADGLAVTVSSGGTVVLADGGRWRGQAAELLADARVRRLAAVVASHPDEDHVGGLSRVIASTRVDRLLLPAWARASVEMAPLVRIANRRGVRVAAAARGSCLRLGDVALLVVWPPPGAGAAADNERSLVVHAVTPGGAVLIGADIDRTVETRLARSGHLASAVLVVPHHGSRSSCSEALLDAVRPDVVLVPAGPLNRHHHPHPEVLERLAERGLPVRYPLRDGRCGARWLGGRWVPYPDRARP